jgi:16S rRNA (guanine527-N7)-methyltransferase
MNKKEFQKYVTQDFHNINKSFFTQIEIYKEFLQKYNQNINLTRLDSNDKIYADYFYESIIPYKQINFDNIVSFLDIGSGSGIPGVVLKLLYPHLQLTIIESNNKKCIFLKALSKILKIQIKILNQRAEDIKENQREYYDLVTSRAVAMLPIILEISLPYLKIDGICVEPKSLSAEKESKDINKIISALGCRLESTNQFTSINEKKHFLFIIKKIYKTNKKYPRN